MDRSWPSRARRWSAVVVVALLAACTSGGGEPEGTVQPDEAPGGLVWTRSEAPSLRSDRRGGTLGDIITAPGGGFLVAGTVFDADGRPSPTVWSSPDGERWDATEVPADGGARLWAAASANRTTVVAGQAGADRRGPAVVYVAPPDAGFELVGDPLFDQPGLSIEELAAGPGGFLAVGSRYGDPDRVTVVFHSEDGRQWQAVEGAQHLLNEASGSQVSDVAVESGGYVMVGSTGGLSGRGGVVWHSADGAAWTQHMVSESSSMTVNTVTGLRDGFAAAGHEMVDGLKEPRVWRSRDGRAWEPVEAEFELHDDRSDNRGVTVRALAHGNGWFAVGGGLAAEYLWRGSHDLRSWSRVPLPAGPEGLETPELDLLATRASATVAGTRTPGRPLILREANDTVIEVTAAETAFPPPATGMAIRRVVRTEHGPVLLGMVIAEERAVGHRRWMARLWRPEPEHGWRQVGGEELDQAMITDVADLGGELVGVGQDAVTDTLLSEGNPRPVVWRSPDAESWARVTGPGIDALRGETTARINSVAKVGAGVVAGGWELPGGGELGQAVLWWAVGPEQWERLAVDPPPDGIARTGVSAVCAVGDWAVAVGYGWTPAGERGMVWVGGARTQWSVSAPDAMAAGGTSLEACHTTSGTVVAVGQRGGEGPDEGPDEGTDGSWSSAGVWTSTDGRTWTVVESPSFSGDGPRRLWSVTADDRGRLYAVGEYEREGWTSPGLWRSHDGTEWELVELPEELFRGDDYESVDDLDVVDGELVLVGLFDDDAAVWTAPLPADWSD